MAGKGYRELEQLSRIIARIDSQHGVNSGWSQSLWEGGIAKGKNLNPDSASLRPNQE